MKPKRRPFQIDPPDNFKWTGKATQAADTWLEHQRKREDDVKRRLATTPLQEFVYIGGGSWAEKPR